MSGKRKALIVTGEASGDLHGAELIDAAAEVAPELTFYGVGGPRMAAAGCDIVVSNDALAVMGLVEVIGRFPTIYGVFQTLKKILFGADRPDVLILIDSPDFNLRLARQARKAGVPVLYYVSPQVWAWRRGRVRKIARLVDCLAVILPFEAEFYRGLDIRVEYVGNPLVDAYAVPVERSEFLRRHQLDEESPVVGLFPGSRESELNYMLETILETAREILARKPRCQFLMPVAPTFGRDQLVRRLGEHELPLTLVRDDFYSTANACDAVLTVSGTATLQTALTGTPMAIIYKMNRLTYLIGRRLVRVPFIGLANIVAGKQVAREFIQDDAEKTALADEICRILDDDDYRARLKQDLATIWEKMGPPGCSRRVALMARDMCEENT